MLAGIDCKGTIGAVRPNSFVIYFTEDNGVEVIFELLLVSFGTPLKLRSLSGASLREIFCMCNIVRVSLKQPFPIQFS